METEKFIESRKVEDFEIWTDEGWVDIQEVHKTIKFDVWVVQTENFELQCADEHIVIGENRKEIYVKDLKVGDKLITENGLENVIRVEKLDIEPEHMYDLSIDSENHTFFSNGILSHNSTIATIFMLWTAIFNNDQRILLVANKESTAKEIFKRIRTAYEQLPNWLKSPVQYYGLESLELSNGSRIGITTTTGTAGRGSSANLLFVDEASFIDCLDGSSTSIYKNKKTDEIRNLTMDESFNDFIVNKTIDVDDWEILTDDGYRTFKGIMHKGNEKTVKLTFEDKTELICSPDHELLTISNNFILARKSRYRKIKSENGYKKVISVKKNGKSDLYDVINVDGSKYITNGVVSHNCNLLDEFWASVYPIISSSTKSKVIMASTPKDTTGLFYKLYDGSVKGTNNWAHMVVKWDEIPGRNDKWKRETIASLGDESVFRREFECCDGKTIITILDNNFERDIMIEELFESSNNNVKVLTPDGFKSFGGMQKLEKECLEIKLQNTFLKCSKNHKVLTKNNDFKFVEDISVGELICVKDGFDIVTDIKNIGILSVYDLLNVEGNIYYTNDIVSHNCQFDQVGESAIDQELFNKMKKNAFEPLYVFDEGKYLLWETPNEERLYVAGVDVAEGVGKDATVIQILDITDLRNIKQVGVYHNNKISPVEFTPKLREILQHWGDPLAFIERNNCGGIVVDNLKKDFNYENIVNWGIDMVTGKKVNKLGIVSHTNTKYSAIMNQRYWVNTIKTVQINDVNTVLELNDFVRLKQNTWGAKTGSHDDRVMSLTWALLALHDSIVENYFDVIERDENNRPSAIKSVDYGIKYFINPTSIYTNEKTGAGGDALPIIVGSQHTDNPDIDDLHNQGWTMFFG